MLALLAGVIATEELRFIGDAIERQGVDAFYEQPSAMPSGAPGALIRSDPLLGAPLASRAWRIMYHSRDLNGADVVVTGVVVTPLGPAPAGGRTVVSWGHPTTGSARDCAPSYGFDPFAMIEGLRALLARGYTVVATDYAGMGTAGPDSYLIGVTEGNNVLDAVRAAQAIPGAEAGSDVILWGHSQGGQAVLFAAERAKDYAPELTIRAVAAAAPAANLQNLMKAHLDDISGVTIGSYAFAAFSQVYADTPGTGLDTILAPEAIALLPEMNSLCLLQNISELHAIGDPVVGRFVTSDPTTTQPWARLLAENSAGSAAFDAPLLLVQGLADKLVVPQDTEEFATHEASMGMDVTFEPISFATHGTVAYLAIPGFLRWLDTHALTPR
jgi:alpha-beta hydrolase superfamily lysophospholipase